MVSNRALCRVRLGFSRRLLLTWMPLAEWNTLLRRAFAKDAAFKKFAKAEMQGIIARDAEDDEKLAQGIRAAIAKGAVPPMSKIPLEPLTEIDVLGKTADDVALEIVAALGDAPGRGCVARASQGTRLTSRPPPLATSPSMSPPLR